jgi:DNA gyrase subunit A
MVNFYAHEVRPMGRTASGVKGIDLSDGSVAVGVTTSLEGKYILSITDRGFGKMSDASDYRLTKRGAKGVSTLKATDKVGKLVTIRAVDGDEDLMVITAGGIFIRTSLEQVRIAGRNTQGVKIINLEARQRVSSIAIVAHEDPEEILEGEEIANENTNVDTNDEVISETLAPSTNNDSEE